MRRLLVVLVVLLAGIVGLGFYQGWFRVSTASTDDKVNTTITIDKDKLQADEQKAKEKDAQYRTRGQGENRRAGRQSQRTGKPTLRPCSALEMLIAGPKETRSHAMQATIELPKAFSVRDDRELPLIQDLMARLNPKLLVVQVATGMHVDGGYTVNWGLVYLDGQPLTDEDVTAALQDAGLDAQHNAEIKPSRIWVNNATVTVG